MTVGMIMSRVAKREKNKTTRQNEVSKWRAVALSLHHMGLPTPIGTTIVKQYHLK